MGGQCGGNDTSLEPISLFQSLATGVNFTRLCFTRLGGERHRCSTRGSGLPGLVSLPAPKTPETHVLHAAGARGPADLHAPRWRPRPMPSRRRRRPGEPQRNGATRRGLGERNTLRTYLNPFRTRNIPSKQPMLHCHLKSIHHPLRPGAFLGRHARALSSLASRAASTWPPRVRLRGLPFTASKDSKDESGVIHGTEWD